MAAVENAVLPAPGSAPASSGKMKFIIIGGVVLVVIIIIVAVMMSKGSSTPTPSPAPVTPADTSNTTPTTTTSNTTPTTTTSNTTPTTTTSSTTPAVPGGIQGYQPPFTGGDWWFNDIQNTPNSDPTACAASCTSASNCVGFTVATDSQNCWIKSSLDPAQFRAQSNRKYYLKTGQPMPTAPAGVTFTPA